MYPKKMVKAGGLLLLVAGLLLATACRSPVDGHNPVGPVDIPQDKTSLIDKIAEAQALFDSLVVSDNGTDVEKTRYWINSTWALKCAIDDAQAIADAPNATAEEIQLALEALIEAYDTANAAKKPGTKGGPDPVDKSALQAKIAATETLAASLRTSTNNGNDIPPNEKWVTDLVQSTLAAAIQAAQAVANDGNATAEEVASALSELTEAYDAADNAKQSGTTPNKAALIAKIGEAVGRMINVKKSDTAGSEWMMNESWVTSAVYTALEDALTVAERARDNDNATKVAVDTALADLITAFNGFNPQPGRSVADKDALNALIEVVEQQLNSVQVSADGMDIYDNAEWVIADVYNALEAVLNQARAIVINAAAEQGAVDAITSDLQDAFAAFNPQSGKKTADHLDFYVTFTTPGDETITLGADRTLSWAGNSELQITVEETFAGAVYQWYVDGIIRGETGNSVTFYARDFRVGTHTVTLKVTTAGGAPYSKTLTFTVN